MQLHNSPEHEKRKKEKRAEREGNKERTCLLVRATETKHSAVHNSLCITFNVVLETVSHQLPCCRLTRPTQGMILTTWSPLPISQDRGHERQNRGKERLCWAPQVMGGGGTQDQTRGVAGATRSAANERARRRWMRGVMAPPGGRREARHRRSAAPGWSRSRGGEAEPERPDSPMG